MGGGRYVAGWVFQPVRVDRVRPLSGIVGSAMFRLRALLFRVAKITQTPERTRTADTDGERVAQDFSSLFGGKL